MQARGPAIAGSTIRAEWFLRFALISAECLILAFIRAWFLRRAAKVLPQSVTSATREVSNAGFRSPISNTPFRSFLHGRARQLVIDLGGRSRRGRRLGIVVPPSNRHGGVPACRRKGRGSRWDGSARTSELEKPGRVRGRGGYAGRALPWAAFSSCDTSAWVALRESVRTSFGTDTTPPLTPARPAPPGLRSLFVPRSESPPFMFPRLFSPPIPARPWPSRPAGAPGSKPPCSREAHTSEPGAGAIAGRTCSGHAHALPLSPHSREAQGKLPVAQCSNL